MTESTSESNRDATTLTVLGSFFCIMGVLVLIGSASATDKISTLVISLVSGGTLLLIGLGGIALAARLRSKQTEGPDTNADS